MSRRLARLTLDRLDDLPDPCRHCAFWELDPRSSARLGLGDGPLGGALARRTPPTGRTLALAAGEKEAWVSSVLLRWGSCGTVLYVDGQPAGYALYAPPAQVPRAGAFPTSPAADDAVLLVTARVLPEHAGGGLGRVLAQAVAKDLVGRGVRAVEAFGDAAPPDDGRGPCCVVPADYLLAVGFTTVRAHPRWPRLRLELRTAVRWREELEAALERLLGARAPGRLPQPG